VQMLFTLQILLTVQMPYTLQVVSKKNSSCAQ
jgi:hypothetical protein